MKYFSPSFSYIAQASSTGCEVEADVLGRVLGVGEHQDAVVEHDHAPVVRRHDLLEVVLAEVGPAERVGDLLEVEVDLVDAVDADHRRQLADRDVLLVGHHLGDDVADLVVHQRHAGLVGRRAVGVELGHARISFGVSRVRSSSRSRHARLRALAASRRSARPSRRSATRSAAAAGRPRGSPGSTRRASSASAPCWRRRARRRRPASGTAPARRAARARCRPRRRP